MVSNILPSGRQNSISENYLPDIRTTIELFAMHVRTVDMHWQYPSHEHLHYEINYVVDGEQITVVNGKKYLQRSGDIMLIRPCTPHFSTVGQSQKMTYFCLHFIVEDRLFLPLLGRVEEVLHTKDSAFSSAFEPTIQHLIQLAGQSEDTAITTMQRMSIQSAVMTLLAHIAEYLANFQHTSVNDRPTQLAQQIEERIFTSLNAVTVHGHAVNHRTQIAQIAEELGIHPSYCNRVFRNVYGMSPRQYLSELVLNHAKTMLAQPNLPIEQIATLLGYSDVSQFSRQFKRWIGLSPNQYRQNRKRD